MKRNTFFLLSLGCAKNTVDSASMVQLMEQAGYQPVQKPNQAQVLIVNTCGFIQAARDEAIAELRNLARSKKRGQYLIAAGCLTDRYRMDLLQHVQGLDGMLSSRRWMDIVNLVGRLGGAHPARYELPDVPTVGREEVGVLRSAQQGSSAYLKIADGCRRPCAFCSIPLIKGSTVSRPMQAVIADAVQLQAMGVQELILIAQDTTDYGHDLGLQDGLTQLLQQMLPQIPAVPWVRLLYAYPGFVSEQLIELMATQPQLLHYLDIPLQHAHPDVLRRMRRPADVDWTRRTVEKMRKAMPDLALRTTFIVGYPGETEAEFQTLLDFIAEMQFDRVGAFTFSFEPGTASEALGDPIPLALKQERLERLMLLQQEISLARNQALIGKTLDVLVEGQTNDLVIGRSYRDAPEIDGLIFLEGGIPTGPFVRAQVTGALTHDLAGRIVHEPLVAH
ncbi:MAG: 30S ribosomal protein S12 methylthiotransferase RimO [Longilinea sp.]|nr:30S ribosomal protein S12 methylthiotransferase RimO [Longilinea sp.]